MKSAALKPFKPALKTKKGLSRAQVLNWQDIHHSTYDTVENARLFSRLGQVDGLPWPKLGWCRTWHTWLEMWTWKITCCKIHLFSLYPAQNDGGPGVSPGNTVCKMRKFSLNGSPVHYMAQWTHMYTHLFTPRTQDQTRDLRSSISFFLDFSTVHFRTKQLQSIFCSNKSNPIEFMMLVFILFKSVQCVSVCSAWSPN